MKAWRPSGSASAFRALMQLAAREIEAGGEIRPARVIYPTVATSRERAQLGMRRRLARSTALRRVK